MSCVVIKKCPRCGKLGKVISSNNLLSPGICQDCLNDLAPWNDLKAIDKWCRTYNIPFNPDKWMRITKEQGKESYGTYVDVIVAECRDNADYKEASDKGELWDKVNEIWNRNMEFEDILLEIESIKDDWLKIQKSKWGPQYEFSEYLRLEEILNSTIRNTGATSTLTIDAIRKIAIASVMIDRSIRDGEIKAASEYSKMYQGYIKAGGFEDIVDVTNDANVIANIADMCNFLEENGFQFKFYDKEERDIVDKTIADQKNWMRRFVLDSAGIIQQEYNIIADAWKDKEEKAMTDQAIKEVSLDEIIEQKKKGINEELDQSLSEEELEFNEEDLDEDFKL